ncbi:uroporphyrinogen-III C-methyltransferase [Paracoccaceae bacterium GXU_MW_L88]
MGYGIFSQNPQPPRGKVWFVGSGPGDPDLLTLKAARLIGSARVIFHDRLVPEAILALKGPQTRLVDVGKEGFGPSTAQDEINRLIVEHGAGGEIVRLKGGDPAVFARLEEEIDALEEAGIAWEVVPGITAASAAVARLGRGLTDRRRNAAVRILTAHKAEGFAEQDWRSLAEGEIAAIYMGVRAARFMQGRLMAFGADRETPVTVVENASRPGEIVVKTTLADLVDDMNTAGIKGPAVILWGIAARDVEADIPVIEGLKMNGLDILGLDAVRAL